MVATFFAYFIIFTIIVYFAMWLEGYFLIIVIAATFALQMVILTLLLEIRRNFPRNQDGEITFTSNEEIEKELEMYALENDKESSLSKPENNDNDEKK